MIVSRPKTVMNHGTPAAGSLPIAPLSERMRSEARSETDWPNARDSASHDARSCGTRSCHAASESRTRPTSSPKRSSAKRGATGSPSGSGKTSTCRSQRSRGSSAEVERHLRAVDLSALREDHLRLQRQVAVVGDQELVPIRVVLDGLRIGQRLRARRVAEREVEVLDGEDVGEVAGDVELEVELDPLHALVLHGERVLHPVADEALAPDREHVRARARPASGLRMKNAAEKYSILSEESSSGRWPLIVSLSPERKRVSSAKRPSTLPWRSPSSSQMQKVAPSRIRSCWFISSRSGVCDRRTTAQAP